VQQVGVKFSISCDKTSYTCGEGSGELLHILFLGLRIYSCTVSCFTHTALGKKWMITNETLWKKSGCI